MNSVLALETQSNDVYCIAIVLGDQKLLLGKWKNGYGNDGYGKDRWNGLGGKILNGETVEDGAKRCMCECGVDVTTVMDKAGVVILDFTGQSKLTELHIFRVQCSGTPRETEDVMPQWFDFSSIPMDGISPDAERWFPLALNGDYFDAYFLLEDKEVAKAEVKHKKRM